MEGKRINCIGISVGESDFCVSVYVGECPVYIHGTHEQIRAFGREIIEAADHHEATSQKMVAIPATDPAPSFPPCSEVEQEQPVAVAISDDIAI